MSPLPCEGEPCATYGQRARIGYICPPFCAEIFPYEFYKVVPAGVTLAITTLPLTERCRAEVEDATQARAAAIMSASAAILIGRLLTTRPSGRSASLTALAMAAGAPR
jgi:hypothetical protein